MNIFDPVVENGAPQRIRVRTTESALTAFTAVKSLSEVYLKTETPEWRCLGLSTCLL